MALAQLAAKKGCALHVAVIGASGGIGSALIDRLESTQNVEAIYALSRTWPPNLKNNGKTHWLPLDLKREETIANAAETIRKNGSLDIVIIASGILHGDTMKPEKDWRSLNAQDMANLFAVNTFGPTLVMKHFAPLLQKKSSSIIAALSARVGSISDNRLGGWYSYRASKAALNQIIKTFSIELARKNKHAIILGLHPGTVATGLSEPYQANRFERFTPDQSAGYLLSVLNNAEPAMTGKVYDWKGKEVPE